ncbi:MAG TPA: hypothetical protein VKZ53_03405 [Candidatus Angelobacter sp.]|nr:hypothetical protein [Candidatus Angelobacter sp.]
MFRKITNHAGPLLFGFVAALILASGVARFIRSGLFRPLDAIYCAVAFVFAALLLLVLDYTFHHARLVSILVAVFLLAWIFRSPAFAVGLGAAMGAVLFRQR